MTYISIRITVTSTMYARITASAIPTQINVLCKLNITEERYDWRCVAYQI